MHLMIILDGFGYEVVKRYKDNGGFKDFHEPSKVVAPFPTLTDLCIQDLLQGETCDGLESVYFDRQKGRMAGNTLSYLQFKNQPYSKILEFRSSSILDGLSYLAPWVTFDLELMTLKRQFLDSTCDTFRAYLISTAGISTKYATDGQMECLKRLDDFLVEAKAQLNGSLMVTLMSDHGHSYCASRRSPIEKVLKVKGWKFSNTLKGAKDLVYTSFGLVNYASFATLNPRTLAVDLHAMPGVEITSYLDGKILVVLGQNGSEAHIERRGRSSSYESISGDPLRLKPVLTGLQNQNGFFDDDEVMTATINHIYPAPLERLWRAQHDLVKNPEDVIASLGNEWHSGSALLNTFATVKSTHGSLNRTNSLAFVMSTQVVFPEVLRSREVMNYLH